MNQSEQHGICGYGAAGRKPVSRDNTSLREIFDAWSGTYGNVARKTVTSLAQHFPTLPLGSVHRHNFDFIIEETVLLQSVLAFLIRISKPPNLLHLLVFFVSYTNVMIHSSCDICMALNRLLCADVPLRN